jgi:hypothetical protein
MGVIMKSLLALASLAFVSCSGFQGEFLYIDTDSGAKAGIRTNADGSTTIIGRAVDSNGRPIRVEFVVPNRDK